MYYRKYYSIIKVYRVVMVAVVYRQPYIFIK